MSESAEKENLSGLARSIDALFAASAAPPKRATPPPLPKQTTPPPLPVLEEAPEPSAAAPAPRPRRPEMFPTTQMVDVIKVDPPVAPQAATTSDLEMELAAPSAEPWAIELDSMELVPLQVEPAHEPAAVTPPTFAPVADGIPGTLKHAPREVSPEKADPQADFPKAVEALIAGEPGARDRVETLASALRERLALDPLADAAERLVQAASDPLDSWLLDVAKSVINPAVASRLVQRMGQQPDEVVRVGYISLCGRLGVVMANALKGALTGAMAPEVRRVYYDALISMGDTSRPVIEKMLEDENRFLVRDAVVILGRIGGPRAVELVTSALADTDPRVRAEALLALGKLGEAESSQLVLGLLEDSDSSVRLAAAVAAGELKIGRALKPMLNMLDGDHKPETRIQLLGALGKLGDPGAVPAIEKHAVPSMFSKASTDVRVAAYRALHQIGSPHARELVQQASSDKDPGVRVALRDLARAH